jgi:hypothetical protein
VSLAKDMSLKHERWLAETFGGYVTPGSGNQYANQGDVIRSRYHYDVGITFDGKATRSRSLTITLDMIDKLIEQAAGNYPVLALRWYGDDRLTRHVDWVALPAILLQDLLERLEATLPALLLQELSERLEATPGQVQT